jgi:3-deoxy-D-manno-octulosonic acid kinase
VLMLPVESETWVLRHYHRGGLVAKLVYDHYLWLARERTRAFREWRLLAQLYAGGLPVPRPIAARAVRHGLLYRADIVTALIPDTQPLSSHLRDGEIAREQWVEIGRMVRRFHDRGVDHPDLTAHNILLGQGRDVFLVDFDNARIKPPGPWQAGGVARLQRSLRKVALEFGTEFHETGWNVLLDAYRSA